MALKLCRVFFGGYEPNYDKLILMGYKVLSKPIPFITVLNEDQGFGRIKGTVRLSGEPLSGIKVQVFKRSTKKLLWETKTDPSGQFKFGNIAKELECYVTVFDESRQRNAKIKDMIVAV